MRRQALIATTLLLAGCGSDPAASADAALSRTDSGTTTDAGAPVATDDGGIANDGAPVGIIDAGPIGPIDGGATCGELVFFDDFDYVVGRDGDTNAVETFQAEGGWTWAKTQQDGAPGAHGYLYTVDATPGFDHPLPGGPGRVLVMEALPETLLSQTDFYLQLGDGEDAAYDDSIPANVWFQFWMNVLHTEAQPSQFQSGKLLYVCNGAYPCHDYSWMMVASRGSLTPLFEMPWGEVSDGDMFLNNIANPDAADFDRTDPYNYWKMGHTNTSEWVARNRWTLVKIHFDTSTRSGVFESWMRPFGGAWTKTAEWIDGVHGYQWHLHPEHVRGHRVLRMPTTIGQADSMVPSYDAWMYMDDFAMATCDGALPVYADAQ